MRASPPHSFLPGFLTTSRGPTDDDFQAIEWWSRAEAELLLDQLFPHGDQGGDFQDAGRGLAVVAMHSALEAYAKSIGISLRRTPLPQALTKFLEPVPNHLKLNADTFRTLVELDETRHIVIHNRGVVDRRYADNVAYNKHVPGERRPLSRQDLLRFADAVWVAASSLRDGNPAKGRAAPS